MVYSQKHKRGAQGTNRARAVPGAFHDVDELRDNVAAVLLKIGSNGAESDKQRVLLWSLPLLLLLCMMHR